MLSRQLNTPGTIPYNQPEAELTGRRNMCGAGLFAREVMGWLLSTNSRLQSVVFRRDLLHSGWPDVTNCVLNPNEELKLCR